VKYIFVFDNEEECNEMWNTQLRDHVLVLNQLIENAATNWINEKNTLLGLVK